MARVAPRLRVGLQLQPQHSNIDTIFRVLAEAEQLGVDSVFNWDHFFPLDGDPDGMHFECWTMLAAWARETTRVTLGPLVSCTGYRNPDLLADMARTVDQLSGGRLILGLGAGWFDKDFKEYRYPFGTDRERVTDFAAAVDRVQARLDRLNPPPVHRIPILVGGEGERRTLPLVARHADIWHSFADPERLRRKHRILVDHCVATGRDPGDITLSVGVVGGPSYDRPAVELGPQLVDLGVGLVTVGVSGPDYDLTRLREWLDWRDG